MIDFHIIKTLVAKELKLFMKNRFFAVITVLGMFFYLLVYFLMPKTVNETLKLGIYAPTIPPILEQFQGEGLKLDSFDSEEKLKNAVLQGKVSAGIAFPVDFMKIIATGERPTLKLFILSNLPSEVKSAVELMLNELILMQTGHPLSVEVKQEILGYDMLGKQIPPRKLIIPLLAFILILTEGWGLATLIAEEIEKKTIQALLVTPITIRDIFIAKGITGTALAFIQVTFFLIITGGLSKEPLLILTTLMMGAIMITGFSFLIGSVAKDFMSVLGWGIIMFFGMSFPSFNILFPGAIITDWIKLIPSYYLVETIYRVINYGYGWKEVWLYLIYILAFSIGLLLLGTLSLRRRFQ